MNQHIRFTGEETYISKAGTSSQWEGTHDVFIDLHGKYGEGQQTSVSKKDEPVARQHEPLYKTKSGYVGHSRGKHYGLPKNVLLHRILRHHPPRGRVVDHKNSERSDNTNRNLVVVSHSANNTNKISKNATKYKGVTKTDSGKYRATKSYQGASHYLGVFESPEEASKTYIEFCDLIRCPVHESKVRTL